MDDDTEPVHGDSVPPREPSDEGSVSPSQHPIPADNTRRLPPLQQPASQTATAPARRGSLTAAVLAGALLCGGAAGIGGAAWYGAWSDDSSASTGQAPAALTLNRPPPLASTSVVGVAKDVLPSVVQINVAGSGTADSGSGIVLSASGDIVTNNHVVAAAAGGGMITVNLNGGRVVPASIVGRDPITDLAVIRAEHVSGLTPATMGDSASLQVGQPVVAVGSPYGLSATVTSGIVSALNRPVSVSTDTAYPAIQTDASINPGNSGGPLLNLAGQVVGINSAIQTSTPAAGGQGGSIGLGFAIPVDEVMPIVNQILNHQTPTHARLGVDVANLPPSSLQEGAVVRTVVRSGAAQRSGVRVGDVITKVGGDPVSGAISLVATIRGERPGNKVALTLIRGTQTLRVPVTLGSDGGKPSN